MAEENGKAADRPESAGPAGGSLGNDLETILSDMKGRGGEVTVYIRYLRNGTPFERERAAEALGEIGDPAAVGPLIDALTDPSETIQYLAAKSLGDLNDPRAADPLIAKLKSADKWVRRAAVTALGLMGVKKAVDPIIPLLGDPKHDVRAFAAWSLGQLGDPRAIGPLRELLADTHEDVRKEALAAIEKLEGASRPVPDASIHA